ncbi:tyrosine-type recombinase/integrase [Paraburkholderia youngii]|uniref:tyrosine-type recombinase/integrase n=1 Tax=Paraburkholderia youngii TaxID=2782701 RepID=UPI0015919844|nr:tyrosine-type recombinase/integrase [Paraburkholderia youngii]NUX55964.1 tyrosine-type recombinase/integrase [Paraburkholderia youngii]
MGRKPTVNLNCPPHMRPRRRGKVTYYYYDWGGKPRREEPLGTDFVLAVKRWAEIEQERIPAAAVPTFGAAVVAYLRDVLPLKAPRTQSGNQKELAVLRQFFDDSAPLHEIEPQHIKQYMHWRHKLAVAWYQKMKQPVPANAGHVRANRELALFSHIFNHAREIGLTGTPNPCAGVRKYSESGRDVYVEDDVFARVYACADAPTRDAMDLAYLAGQRPQDTVSYDERDIRDGFLSIGQGKTGKKLRMEVVGELKAVVDRIKTRKSAYKVVSTALVVNEKGERMTLGALQKRFSAARARAGIPKGDFQFRDLRAKAGTDKTDSSGDIRQAQRQLGHKSLTMTEHYVRKRRGEKVGPTR